MTSKTKNRLVQSVRVATLSWLLIHLAPADHPLRAAVQPGAGGHAAALERDHRDLLLAELAPVRARSGERRHGAPGPLHDAGRDGIGRRQEAAVDGVARPVDAAVASLPGESLRRLRPGGAAQHQHHARADVRRARADAGVQEGQQRGLHRLRGQPEVGARGDDAAADQDRLGVLQGPRCRRRPLQPRGAAAARDRRAALVAALRAASGAARSRARPGRHRSRRRASGMFQEQGR